MTKFQGMTKYCLFLFVWTTLPGIGCKEPGRPEETIGKEGERVYRSGTAKRTRLQLPDGTEVVMNAGSTLHVPSRFNRTNREVALDGEALFTVAAAGKGGSGTDGVAPGNSGASRRGQGESGPGVSHPENGAAGIDSPFVVRTKALLLAVTDSMGNPAAVASVFKVDGYANSPGEEADLFIGRLVARKSYHSTSDNDPEVLGPGEMVMINTDIDLMEKEKSDTTVLRAWMSEQ
ncbi:MAG: FecR family protein [Puia sp.]|nr:FecR family protein [Puia sp.]